MAKLILDRNIEAQIVTSLLPNKVVNLLGPRRVGKTVLIHQIIDKISEPYLLLNGEDIEVRKRLEYRNTQHYLNFLGSIRL